jgi:hypothetical protein
VIEAPVACRIIGSASELAYGMPQALTQIGEALRRSLTVYDVYDQEREPSESVAMVTKSLADAADAFIAAGQHLADAQAAITY